MRARFTISRARYVPSHVDPADGYSVPASYEPPELLKVFGWQPLASDMPVGAELTHRIVTSKLVLAPDVSLFQPSDRVWLFDVSDDPSNADFYHVSEDVRDYNTGPFGYRPGGAVVIERTQG